MRMVSTLGSGARSARRALSRAVTAVVTAAVLVLSSGCTAEDIVQVIVEACPSDPAELGGINWVPDVGTPVFYGHRDLGPDDGAPRSARIFFPSVDGSPAHARLVKSCLARWPVVLFLHGQPPERLLQEPDYHHRWRDLPATLARSGYVVVVPDLGTPTQVINDPEPLRDAMIALLEWVRTDWTEARWVHREQAAVVGHSLGGVLASHVAAAHTDIQAMVSLSGDFANGGPLDQVQVPSLFMWAEGLIFEDLDITGHWQDLSMERYGAVYAGEHFDYLHASDAGAGTRRGACALVAPAAGDLTALFLTLFAPVPLAVNRPTVDLRPPAVQLTERQHFFAGAHLTGLQLYPSDPDCQLDLRWELDGSSGGREF
jgi:dienelactone hydrolase